MDKIREVLENHFYKGQSIDEIEIEERHISEALSEIKKIRLEELPKEDIYIRTKFDNLTKEEGERHICAFGYNKAIQDVREKIEKGE